VQRSCRPLHALLLYRREQWFRSAAVHQRVVLGILEKRLEVEKTPFVLRPHGDAFGVPLGKLIGEGHRHPCPPAVQQCPVAARLLHGFEHRHDGGDADTPCDEAVSRRVDQWKVVTGATNSHSRTLGEVVVDEP
jgi:hypothetical protein